MHVIIVGACDLGYYLAQFLLEEKHDVVVVDRDEAACKKINSEFGIVAVQGDGTEPKTLEKAGIAEADTVVALTGQDEANMVICLLAKELGAKNIAARISRVDYDERALKRLGIDIVIHPEAAAAGYIAELLTKPELLDLAFISRGDAEIMELEVRPNSKIAGKKVSEVEHPAGSAIIALYKGKKIVVPEPNTVIEVGAKALILVKKEAAEKVRQTYA